MTPNNDKGSGNTSTPEISGGPAYSRVTAVRLDKPCSWELDVDWACIYICVSLSCVAVDIICLSYDITSVYMSGLASHQ